MRFHREQTYQIWLKFFQTTEMDNDSSKWQIYYIEMLHKKIYLWEFKSCFLKRGKRFNFPDLTKLLQGINSI